MAGLMKRRKIALFTVSRLEPENCATTTCSRRHVLWLPNYQPKRERERERERERGVGGRSLRIVQPPPAGDMCYGYQITSSFNSTTPFT